MVIPGGIKSLVATGLSKNLKGRVSRQGHAWNLVRADGTWHLIDATWGAGVLDEDDKYVAHFDDQYFFPPQQMFVRNHFPTDPLLQLLEHPIDQNTFIKRPSEQSGDPYWSSAQSLRRTADRNLRICQEGLQNNAALRAKLKK